MASGACYVSLEAVKDVCFLFRRVHNLDDRPRRLAPLCGKYCALPYWISSERAVRTMAGVSSPDVTSGCWMSQGGTLRISGISSEAMASFRDGKKKYSTQLLSRAQNLHFAKWWLLNARGVAQTQQNKRRLALSIGYHERRMWVLLGRPYHLRDANGGDTTCDNKHEP
ncbi:hypothetical protein BD309DRAFT_984687 [Dichomitus squalens]|nr:hypothetical protein BD309DRAFT_984687 [Dichomitus squalens]